MVHVLLFLAIGISHGSGGAQLDADAAARNILDVRFLGPEADHAPDTLQTAAAGAAVKLASHQQILPGGDAIGKPETMLKKLAPLFELSLPPEPYYFPSYQLTEKPRVELDIPPTLALSLNNSSPRTTVLRLLISETGDIDQVIIEESSFSEEEQRLIIEACKQMKFEPGKLDGLPVKTAMRIEMTVEGAAASNSSGTVQ
ncbi:hypothetical protein [Undibacterium sp.]|uniref:energy transducer TonB n=1 Tax=Undibacterium sp. TaxID=1914977 RepID=UPI002D7EAF2D|nr:hypothetical protein [Undibacterium sp.]